MRIEITEKQNSHLDARLSVHFSFTFCRFFMQIFFCTLFYFSFPFASRLVESQLGLGPRLGVHKLGRAADGSELVRLLLVESDVVVLCCQSCQIEATETNARNHCSKHRIRLRKTKKKKKNAKEKKKKKRLLLTNRIDA
jgi:hypothetical protein